MLSGARLFGYAARIAARIKDKEIMNWKVLKSTRKRACVRPQHPERRRICRLGESFL